MLLLLLSMAAAILLPSYWNYEIKMHQIDLAVHGNSGTARISPLPIPIQPQQTTVSPNAPAATKSPASTGIPPGSNDQANMRAEQSPSRDQAPKSEVFVYQPESVLKIGRLKIPLDKSRCFVYRRVG
jgi:hypothetical protein